MNRKTMIRRVHLPVEFHAQVIKTKGPRFQKDENEQIYELLKPLQVVAREMEQRWGSGRLISLVPADLANKFQTASLNLDHAIKRKKVDVVAEKVTNLIKGWKLLDKAALKYGNEPEDHLNPVIWWVTAPTGERYAIVQHQDDMKRVPETSCDRIYTIQEVGKIISQFEQSGNLADIKNEFQGSEIISIKRKGFKADMEVSDPIPFG